MDVNASAGSGSASGVGQSFWRMLDCTGSAGSGKISVAGLAANLSDPEPGIPHSGPVVEGTACPKGWQIGWKWSAMHRHCCGMQSDSASGNDRRNLAAISMRVTQQGSFGLVNGRR